MGDMSVEWEGVGAMQAKLTKMGAEAGVKVGAALFVEGQKVVAKSVPQAPVRDGILRGSATVGQPKVTASGAEVKAGYGGAASDYAPVQHERTDFNHPNGGKAKFLEDPLTEHAGEFAANIADAIIGSF